MVHQYDEENHKYYRVKAYNAEEAAELSDNALKIFKFEYDDKFPVALEQIAKKLKELGHDTFEITEVTEKTKRYVID